MSSDYGLGPRRAVRAVHVASDQGLLTRLVRHTDNVRDGSGGGCSAKDSGGGVYRGRSVLRVPANAREFKQRGCQFVSASRRRDIGGGRRWHAGVAASGVSSQDEIGGQ